MTFEVSVAMPGFETEFLFDVARHKPASERGTFHHVNPSQQQGHAVICIARRDLAIGTEDHLAPAYRFLSVRHRNPQGREVRLQHGRPSPPLEQMPQVGRCCVKSPGFPSIDDGKQRTKHTRVEIPCQSGLHQRHHGFGSFVFRARRLPQLIRVHTFEFSRRLAETGAR